MNGEWPSDGRSGRSSRSVAPRSEIEGVHVQRLRPRSTGSHMQFGSAGDSLDLRDRSAVPRGALYARHGLPDVARTASSRVRAQCAEPCGQLDSDACQECVRSLPAAIPPMVQARQAAPPWRENAQVSGTIRPPRMADPSRRVIHILLWTTLWTGACDSVDVVVDDTVDSQFVHVRGVVLR